MVARCTSAGAAAVLALTLTACAGPSTDATETTTPSADAVSVPSDATHGYAQLADPGAYPAVPGEGWWNNDGIEPELESRHPDTLLVAGWTDEIYEAYARDPQTGLARPVPVSTFDPVPVDPEWPDAWLILDAHSHEVVEVLWHPDVPQDEAATQLPEGFEPLAGAEAERFIALASPVEGVETSVSGDGQVVGMRAIDPDGFGFMVRFDDTDPDAWWMSVAGGEPVELVGFAEAAQHGDSYADWRFEARADTGDCAFTISAVAPPGEDQPSTSLREHVTEALPGLVAALCP